MPMSHDRVAVAGDSRVAQYLCGDGDYFRRSDTTARKGADCYPAGNAAGGAKED